MALKEHTNPQDELINSIEGIHLVDAGAGTGKTHSIVSRYGKILESSVKPEDILLITFTKNAAEEMRQKVIRNLSKTAGINNLLEAPIMTFHSFCSRILKKSGTNAPSFLGLDEYLPGNFSILEDPAFEYEIFRKFYFNFINLNEANEKYRNIFYSLDGEHEAVLGMIKKLCSIGIFPTVKGWSDDDRQKLRGNFEEYSETFDRLNEALDGKTERSKSQLLARFGDVIKGKLYVDFNLAEITIDKKVNPEIKEDLFKDDLQDDFIEFMNDIYISYIVFLLKRNQINYEFMVMFAYLVLYNNKSVRSKNEFEYVMIDEFQDTDEIQFKLIMLVCRSMKGIANLCAVGDWKQGIYGFRNAQIENITEFGYRLRQFKKELNREEIRVQYDIENYKKIIFELNYRSSESILNFSRETFFIAGNNDEKIDTEFVELNFKEPLKPARQLEDLTEIKFYTAKDKADEYFLILKKISELINENEKYKIRVFDKETGEVIDERPIRYSDICVLSRKNNFCLEFQREALKHGIPVNYTGGLEIFSSEQGVLVLAWLKLLINESDISGWLPILDKEGYTYPETLYFKEEIITKLNDGNKHFPEALENFLKHLKSFRNNILFSVEAIISRYKFHDDTGNKIISVLKKWNDTELISLNELIPAIENSAKKEFEIEINNSAEAVLVQTIHKSKGLEYPVVILANVNEKNFPDSKGEQGKIVYSSMSGLRAKTFYGTNGNYYYKYNNWRTDLLSRVSRKSDYDEERRLLYVAVTRTKQYLYITSYKPSRFFNGLLEKKGTKVIIDFDYEIKNYESETVNEEFVKKPEEELNPGKKFVSPHTLMNEADTAEDPGEIRDNYESSEYTVNYAKKKKEFGILIHNAAYRIANGMEVNSDIKEVRRVKKFIKELEADELRAEVDFLYPEGDRVIRGTIDLLAFYDDRIEVIDYKTDSGKANLDKYKIQLNVYKEVVKSIYKKKEVKGKIYFVSIDEVVDV